MRLRVILLFKIFRKSILLAFNVSVILSTQWKNESLNGMTKFFVFFFSRLIILTTRNSRLFSLCATELSFVFGSDHSSFIVRTRDRVVDSKDVSWVNLLLQCLLPFDGVRRNSPFHKLLSNFSNAMVMGDAASSQENLIPGCVFNRLILINELGAIHALVIQGEINVDCCASLIDLSHAERDPDTFLAESLLGGLVEQSGSHALAHIRHVSPLAGQLE